MAKKSKTFASALRKARDAMHLSQSEFGKIIGAAARSVTRWEVHGDLPPPAQRTHIVVCLAGRLPAAQLEELAQSMEVDSVLDVPALGARAKAGVEREGSRHALEAALLVLAEDLDISARKVRPAVRKLVVQLDATGLSVAELRAHLDPAR